MILIDHELRQMNFHQLDFTYLSPYSGVNYDITCVTLTLTLWPWFLNLTPVLSILIEVVQT